MPKQATIVSNPQDLDAIAWGCFLPTGRNIPKGESGAPEERNIQHCLWWQAKREDDLIMVNLNQDNPALYTNSHRDAQGYRKVYKPSHNKNHFAAFNEGAQVFSDSDFVNLRASSTIVLRLDKVNGEVEVLMWGLPLVESLTVSPRLALMDTSDRPKIEDARVVDAQGRQQRLPSHVGVPFGCPADASASAGGPIAVRLGQECDFPPHVTASFHPVVEGMRFYVFFDVKTGQSHICTDSTTNALASQPFSHKDSDSARALGEMLGALGFPAPETLFACVVPPHELEPAGTEECRCYSFTLVCPGYQVTTRSSVASHIQLNGGVTRGRFWSVRDMVLANRLRAVNQLPYRPTPLFWAEIEKFSPRALEFAEFTIYNTRVQPLPAQCAPPGDGEPSEEELEFIEQQIAAGSESCDAAWEAFEQCFNEYQRVQEEVDESTETWTPFQPKTVTLSPEADDFVFPYPVGDKRFDIQSAGLHVMCGTFAEHIGVKSIPQRIREMPCLEHAPAPRHESLLAHNAFMTEALAYLNGGAAALNAYQEFQALAYGAIRAPPPDTLYDFKDGEPIMMVIHDASGQHPDRFKVFNPLGHILRAAGCERSQANRMAGMIKHQCLQFVHPPAHGHGEPSLAEVASRVAWLAARSPIIQGGGSGASNLFSRTPGHEQAGNDVGNIVAKMIYEVIAQGIPSPYVWRPVGEPDTAEFHAIFGAPEACSTEADLFAHVSARTLADFVAPGKKEAYAAAAEERLKGLQAAAP